jgi:hypothetical protein
MALAIYINAGNSTSGNPKRGWIIANDDGIFINFVDEGYEGVGALKTAGYANIPRTSRIDVTPSTYKDAYRQSQDTTRMMSGTRAATLKV